MPQTDETREEALKRLNTRAKALEGRTVKAPPNYGANAAGYGYRIIGLLIGGVFVGLAFGAIVDVLAKTPPFGMIVGVLVGFGFSIWMAVRSAQRASAEMSKAYGPAKDLPDDEVD